MNHVDFSSISALRRTKEICDLFHSQLRPAITGQLKHTHGETLLSKWVMQIEILEPCAVSVERLRDVLEAARVVYLNEWTIEIVNARPGPGQSPFAFGVTGVGCAADQFRRLLRDFIRHVLASRGEALLILDEAALGSSLQQAENAAWGKVNDHARRLRARDTRP